MKVALIDWLESPILTLQLWNTLDGILAWIGETGDAVL